MDDCFERHGLRRIINVSGTETPYGASRVRPEVIEAVRSLVGHAVYIDELQDAASRTIARVLGCESGCITGCTAASISMAVAGCMTGTDLGRIEQLPDVTGMRDEVVVQKGHVVDYGHNVTQNIRLTGAKVVEIGAATECRVHQLRHVLSARSAAALYVVSHLTVQHRMIDLETFVRTCREAGVPTIVDAASVTDPRPYLEAGADLVLFSAHKAFASLTAGIVAGRKDQVAACLAQQAGIGRPMKVGKEGIVGAMAALDAWHADPRAEIEASTAARLRRFRDRVAEVRGVRASLQGRTQVRIEIDPRVAAMSARDLSARLRARDPAVLAWDLHAETGTLLFTLSRVSDDEAATVARAVEESLGAGA
jgi:L-seryl-tRNA(Ser) seleniumtransferase